MLINRSLWKSFKRDLSDSDIDSIQDRLTFLQEVLQKYSDNLSEDDSSNLDLDLTTYISSPAKGMTPWLIHVDWLEYASRARIADKTRVALSKLLRYQASRSADIDLRTLAFLVSEVFEAVGEDDAVVLLACVDLMVNETLSRLAARRLSVFE